MNSHNGPLKDHRVGNKFRKKGKKRNSYVETRERLNVQRQYPLSRKEKKKGSREEVQGVH